MGRTGKAKANTATRSVTSTKTRSEVKPPPVAKRLTLYVVLTLSAATLLCYANTLTNGFVFDDHDLVLGNKLLRSISNLPRIAFNSYRPARDISYVIDFAVWGERPLGFHLTNVLLHTANTILVFFLMLRVSDRILCAGIAAAIFALHPIQTDAVSYISGRRDLLFTVFYLASFMNYLKYRQSKAIRYFLLFLGCWGISLLSKEMAASLPSLIYLWNFCDAWREESGSWAKRTTGALWEAFRRDKWLYVGLVVAGLLYAGLMIFVRRASIRAGAGGFDYWGGSVYSTMLTVARVHAWYLKQLVYPTPIAQYFGAFDISDSILDIRVIGSLTVVITLVVLSFTQLRRRWLISFALVSYFALLLPVSQIVPHHELLADHYLYLPMASFGLLVGLVVELFSRKGRRLRMLVYGLTVVAIVTMATLSMLRNRDWKDDLAVWQANYEAVPNSPRAAYNLAAHNLGRNPRRAEELFKRSLELDPTYAPTYTSLAQLYLSQNRLAECEALILGGLGLPDDKLRSFITRQPRRFRSQLTTVLAIVKGKRGETAKAEDLLWKAIEIFPANVEPYSALANVYHDKDRAKEISMLEKAVAANSFVYEVLHRLTFILVEDRKYDQAIPHLNQILRLVPADFYANYQLAQIYRTKSECARSAGHLEAARSAITNSEETMLVADAARKLEQQCGRQ